MTRDAVALLAGAMPRASTGAPHPPARQDSPHPPARQDSPHPPARQDSPHPPAHEDSTHSPAREDSPHPPAREDSPRSHPTVWADLGAGDGTFTRALVELLGPASRIYAVDRDLGAVRALERLAAREAPNVIPVHADFTAPLALPGLGDDSLDGVLLANSLHFVRDASEVLTRLARLLRPGGRMVVIEYDRRAASPWVPHPVTPARLAELASAASLSTPGITATRRSRYGGNLYVAALDRPG